jgi:hypothetical protein
MQATALTRVALFSLCAVVWLTAGGCGSDAGGAKSGKQATPTGDTCAVADNWCCEHGVPEDICGQCNPKVAAECQKKGDWCKEHHRPQSQCFLCNPKLAGKFAAEYEVKYGRKPPKSAEK